MDSIDLMPVRVQIASKLRKAILAGEYKSGDELNLIAIADKLGVSRTPVREALQQLSQEGLVDLRLNRVATVAKIDEKFIRDHYEIRILLEGNAAYNAAKKGMETLPLIKKNEFMMNNIDSISFDDYCDLNLKTHLAIWKAADNAAIYSILQSLWNGPSSGKANNLVDHQLKSLDEHVHLLKMIEERKPEDARDLMQKHIIRSMNNILDSFHF